jgi:hypothetical protein
MLPSVLDETLVHQFNYWNQGIRRGMRYRHELYTLLQSYSLQERLKAYALGFEQAELGEGVCITVSKTSYVVWLGLRSPSASTSYQRIESMTAVGGLAKAG